MDDAHTCNEFGSKYNVIRAVRCVLIYNKFERKKLSEFERSWQITWQRLSPTPHFSLQDERRFGKSHERVITAKCMRYLVTGF